LPAKATHEAKGKKYTCAGIACAMKRRAILVVFEVQEAISVAIKRPLPIIVNRLQHYLRPEKRLIAVDDNMRSLHPYPMQPFPDAFDSQRVYSSVKTLMVDSKS
jgi:hypothetical protein